MFRISYLRWVFITSVVILTALPVYNHFYVRHTLLDQLMQSRENIAENFVRYLLFTCGEAIPFSTGTEISPSIRSIFEKVRTDFHFWKIKCFDPDGTVTYSTDISDVGKRAQADAFYTEVVRGNVRSFEKYSAHAKVMISERPPAMVSTYVPIMVEGRLQGVIEIYADVVLEKRRIDEHIGKTTVLLTLFSGGLLGVFYVLVRRVRRTAHAHILVEHELRDAREQYLAVMNGLPVGLAVVNREFQMLQVNTQMLDWFPFIDVNKKALCYGVFGPATEENKKKCPCYKTIEDGKEHEVFVCAYVRGVERQFRVMSTPVFGQHENIESIIMMFEDITETRTHERMLHQFRRALDRSGDMILIIDRATLRCIDVNETATRVLMNSRQELLAMKLQEIWPYYTEHVFGEIFDAMITSKEERHVIESVCRRRDGEEIPTETVFNYVEHDGRDIFIAVVRDASERRQAEKVLCDSEFRYRMLFENATDAILVRRFNGAIIEVNKIACRTFGYSKEEFLRMSLSDIVAVEAQADREALHDRTSGFREFALKTKDGRAIHVELNSQVIHYDNAPAIINVIHDMSERKRYEQELENSLTFLQVVIDTAQSPIYYKDAKGIYRGCNTAFAKMLGKRKSEIIGKSIFEVFHEDYAKVYYEKDEELLKSKSAFQVYESKVPYVDGTDHDVLLYKATFTSPGGAVGGIVGVVLDITDRKKIEAALQESEERYRQLSAVAFEGILVHDGYGIALDGNEQLFAMFGYERDEILHKPVLSLVLAPESAEYIRHYVGSKDDRTYDLIGRKKNGEVFPIEVRVRSAVMDGKPVRVAVCRDMTTWKSQEELLRKAKEVAEAASKAKNQFLANVSHEIRTPMNGIIGFSDLLGQTILSEEQKDYVETIRESSKALLHLINDILDIAKIEANQICLEHIQFDLDYLIKSVVKLLGPKVRSEYVQLKYDIAADMPRFYMGDPTRIRQILINLIGNAIKFTERGAVTVSAAYVKMNDNDSRSILISVKDTGVGIPAEKLHMIFETFSQADPSVTRQYAGNGLGLSIAKSLVERMGGSITVHSELGRGSEFVAMIPLSVADRAEQPKPVAVDRLNGKSVVVIGRSEVANADITAWCHALGMQVVHHTQSSADGVSWLLSVQQPPDLIMIDIMMPLMDGYRCVEELRKSGRFSASKIIAISAEGSPGMAQDAHNAGFDAFIAEPLVQDEFIEIVRLVFGEHQQIVTRHMANEDILKGSHILVAEDNAVNLKLITLLLDQFGCLVDVATDGRQVIEKTKTGSYDLILMDIQMPHMSGIEATRVIRQEQHLKVPIIALTAAAMEDDKRCAFESGMNDYVSKPIDMMKFKTTLTKWVRA